ncbi:MAG: hypothetical protein WC010_04290 [Candidatus Absconditabacterales bacterium]
MTTEKKHENTKLIILVLLALNVLLGIYIAFFKNDALSLETLKVGGAENMKIATELYQLPAFSAQGKQQLEEGLQMFQGGAAQQPAAEQAPTTTETAPIITE